MKNLSIDTSTYVVTNINGVDITVHQDSDSDLDFLYSEYTAASPGQEII